MAYLAKIGYHLDGVVYAAGQLIPDAVVEKHKLSNVEKVSDDPVAPRQTDGNSGSGGDEKPPEGDQGSDAPPVVEPVAPAAAPAGDGVESAAAAATKKTTSKK